MLALPSNKIFKLKGSVQNYAWGGYEYIPNLLHFENKDNKPCAEYWMGAHPSAPSVIQLNGQEISLFDAIKDNPISILTEAVYNKFGELPYLYKILDVNEMLSIQVHPSKVEAEKGFEAENAAGIPLNAPHRNYKDKNHKPEIMIALGEFWLLHGFMTLDAIEQRLQDIKEFNVLLSIFKAKGLKELYRFLMEMSQEEVDTILVGLVKREIRKKQNGELNKSMPGWWAAKVFKEGEEVKNVDRGVFSIYLFNIVGVQKGDGVFQAAGVPHAYLEGQNVELMANSDNVLRGGLTPKHIDVPELMKHTLFQPVIPNILKGNSIGNLEKNYPCPVPDFDISKIALNAGNTYTALSSSPEIFIVIEGGAVVNGSNTNITIKKGDCFMVLPNEDYKISASGYCELYKAFVSL
ncbi:MAG: mannose-6-phosphate isomerase, class I [Chitinophagaceae bacterium]